MKIATKKREKSSEIYPVEKNNCSNLNKCLDIF
jgi:hypothetical protein